MSAANGNPDWVEKAQNQSRLSFGLAVTDMAARDDKVVAAHNWPPVAGPTSELNLGDGVANTNIVPHAGRLWATRRPDRGLTVQFTLPRERAGN